MTRACRKCGDISFYLREVTFKDGTVHAARYCNQFQHFIDYAANEIPAGMFIMPYGKYKGMPLQTIYESDRNYAKWLCENAKPSIKRRMLIVMGEVAQEMFEAFIAQSDEWMKSGDSC